MPQGASLEACRPDALESLALLSSVPPMQGGEYWTVDVLSGVFARIESALAVLAAKQGGDLLAAVASVGPVWRDVGKVSLHLDKFFREPDKAMFYVRETAKTNEWSACQVLWTKTPIRGLLSQQFAAAEKQVPMCWSYII